MLITKLCNDSDSVSCQTRNVVTNSFEMTNLNRLLELRTTATDNVELHKTVIEHVLLIYNVLKLLLINSGGCKQKICQQRPN